MCSTRCPLRDLGSEWLSISACLIWRRPGVEGGVGWGSGTLFFPCIHGLLLVSTNYHVAPFCGRRIRYAVPRQRYVHDFDCGQGLGQGLGSALGRVAV